MRPTAATVVFLVACCMAWTAPRAATPEYVYSFTDPCVATVVGMPTACMAGIEVVAIPPRSPNLNAICERSLGAVRRECLDHVVILSERRLRRVLKDYVESYFNSARPHQGLNQRIPSAAKSRSVAPAGDKVVAFPILGGLHHDHRLAA